jgi:hypothetical protein
MKKALGVSFVAVVLAACGSVGLPPFDSIFAKLPRVIAIEPSDGASVPPTALVAMEFSERIDSASIDPSTLAILPDEEGQEAADIAQALVGGDVRGIEGVYEFSGEGRVATFRPREPYVAGKAYRVVATGGIMSVEMLPLANRFGGADMVFMSTFTVDGGSSEGENTGEESAGQAVGEAAAGEADQEGGGEETSLHRPSFLVINELLSDVPGDDTNGVLFIELYGEALAAIEEYRVVFVNGDNGETTEEIDIPAGALVPEDGIFLIADSKTGQGDVSTVAGADFIDNFDPQNGPDCVQLFDDQGQLVDALGYGTPIVALAGNGLACFESEAIPRAAAGLSLTRTNGIDQGDNSSDFHPEAVPSPGVL